MQDIASFHDKTAGSSLAAAIAASFFIKSSALPSPRVSLSPSPSPPPAAAHSYLSLPHPSTTTSSSSSFLVLGGDSKGKKQKNVVDSAHGRSNSDGTEELIHTLPSRPSASRRYIF